MRVALIACAAWANWAPNPALLLLAAQLRRHGHEADLYDLNIDTYHAVAPQFRDWWLDHNSYRWERAEICKELLDAHREFFEHYVATIAATRPGLVAFSINSGARASSKYLAQIVKRALPGVPIVAGGSDCFRSEHFDGHMIPGIVDAICPAEGDFAICDLVDAVEEQGIVPVDLPGFITWEDGRLRDNGDPKRPQKLDVLAPVTLDGVDLSRYTLQNRVTMSISRGCIKRCAFCNEGPNFFKFRTHSVAWMIDQLRLVLPQIERSCAPGQRPHINFNDSLINGDMEVLGGLCDQIIAQGLAFTWGGMAIVRPEMDPEFVAKMRRAGCLEICWGIESGSTKVLSEMRKGIGVSLIDQVLRSTAAAGISQYGNIIVGFPGEGAEEFAETLLFLVKNASYFPCLGLPIFTPVKNSLVFKTPHRFGMASLDLMDWKTTDSDNTPEIRIFRRRLLARVLAERKFDQGKYNSVEQRFDFEALSPEIQLEFRKIYRAFARLSSEYLARCTMFTLEPLPDIAEDIDLSNVAVQRDLKRVFDGFVDAFTVALRSHREELPLLADRFADAPGQRRVQRASLTLLELPELNLGQPRCGKADDGQWRTIGGGLVGPNRLSPTDAVAADAAAPDASGSADADDL